MAGSQIAIIIRRIDDSTVKETFDKIESLMEVETTKSFMILPRIKLAYEELPSREEGTGKYALNSASLSCDLDQDKRLNIEYRRSQICDDKGANCEKSHEYDTFQVTFGRELESWQSSADLARKIIEEIRSLDVIGNLHQGSSTNQTLHQLILGLSDTHRQSLARLDEKIIELSQKSADLEEAFQTREKKRLDDYEARISELNEQEAQLQRQSHMSERRRIREMLTARTGSEVKKSIVTRDANITRWIVFATIVVLAGLSGAFSFQSFDLYAQEQSPSLLSPFLIRGFLSSVVAIGALAYATAWLRGFYAQDIATAKEYERFNYDLSRASWIIEAVLEIQSEKKGEVPQVWVERVSRNLFAGSESGSEDSEGSQALAALLGYTASARFGPDGPTFDISKRGARRLVRDAANEDRG